MANFFEDDAQEATGPSTEQLSEIARLAAHQLELEAAVEHCEKELDDAKRKLRAVSEDKLPALMEAAGVSQFTTTNGANISLDEKLYCSVPKKRMDEVCAWLERVSADTLIQTDVGMRFDATESKLADALLDVLRDMAPEYQDRLAVARSVNTGRLKSLIKELREAGEDVPMSMLGAYIQRKSTITTA